MALVKCKECGSQLSTKAQACPSCGAKVKRPMTMLRFVGYAILGCILLAVIGSCIERNEASLSPEQKQAREQAKAQRQAEAAKRDAEDQAKAEEKACSSDVSAYVMAQSFVTKRLKAPATAKLRCS